MWEQGERESVCVDESLLLCRSFQKLNVEEELRTVKMPKKIQVLLHLAGHDSNRLARENFRKSKIVRAKTPILQKTAINK